MSKTGAWILDIQEEASKQGGCVCDTYGRNFCMHHYTDYQIEPDFDQYSEGE